MSTTPFIIKDNSGFAETMYITIKAEACVPDKKKKEPYFAKINTSMATCDTKPCFAKIDAGIVTCDPQTLTSQTNSQDFAYKLDSLPKSNNFEGGYEINLHQMVSGRLYISLYNPMKLEVQGNNKTLKIVDPSPTNVRDDNYYTHYNTVEFTYNGSIWVNPTAVDFVSPLSIHIQRNSSTQSIKSSGFIGNKVDDILNYFNDTKFKDCDVWNSLALKYTGKDNLNANINTTLRILSPGKGALEESVKFPSDYLTNNSYINITGQSFVSEIFQYYANNTIRIDVSELDTKYWPKGLNKEVDKWILTGQVHEKEFVFTDKVKSPPISIKQEDFSTQMFFGGSIQYDPTNIYHGNKPGSIIVKQLTSAFEIGHLPLENNTLVDKNYFGTQKTNGNYFKYNAIIGKENTNCPLYDLYGAAVYSLNNNETESTYAFAYSDALGIDGTLSDNNIDSPTILTIGDMTGVKIPDITRDNSEYNVTFILGDHAPHTTKNPHTGMLVHNVYYKSDDGKDVVNINTKNNPMVNLRTPVTLILKDCGNNTDTMNKLYKVYLDHKLVRPNDASFGAAIAINDIDDGVKQIILPGTPNGNNSYWPPSYCGGEIQKIHLHDEI